MKAGKLKRTTDRIRQTEKFEFHYSMNASSFFSASFGQLLDRPLCTHCPSPSLEVENRGVGISAKVEEAKQTQEPPKPRCNSTGHFYLT